MVISVSVIDLTVSTVDFVSLVDLTVSSVVSLLRLFSHPLSNPQFLPADDRDWVLF